MNQIPAHTSCPCCGNDIWLSNDDPPLSQEAELQALNRTPWWAKPFWTVLCDRRHKVQWACSECLQAGRALRGDASKQLYCDRPPYLAYFDITLECQDCGRLFCFAKEEQQHWYETLGFWVMSRPKECLPCRRKRRERGRANLALQRALEDLDETDPMQLANVSKLCLAIGARRKAMQYLRRAKNLASTAAMRAEMLRSLEDLEHGDSIV